MQDQEIFVAFIKGLPNGKTSYPMNLEINKMGTNVEVIFRMRLKQETPLTSEIHKSITK